MAYEASLKAKWDTQNAFAYVEKKSKEEGREEEKRNIAKELKKLGVSLDNISKSTGLSPEEIEGL